MLKRAAILAMALLLAAGCAAGGAQRPVRDTDYMELWERRSARGPVPPEEQVETLRGLGLDIPDTAVDDLVSMHDTLREIFGDDEAIFDDDYTYILECVGLGEYDFESGVWTPSSQIYSFDAEVWDIDGMYQTYFEGLQAISEGELTFTDVTQDDSGANYEEGTGTVLVEFCLNGRQCRYEAAFMGDWLDISIRNEVNRCLEELNIEKRFYATDASQGETIFFCTEEWAKQFETATLCHISDRAWTW